MKNQKECNKQEIEIFKKMSPAHKIKVMFQLRDMAILLAKAGFRMRHPKWSENRVDNAVRKHFLHART